MYDFDISEFINDDSGELTIIEHKHYEDRYHANNYGQIDEYVITAKYKGRYINVEITTMKELKQPYTIEVMIGDRCVKTSPGVPLKKYIADHVEASTI